MVPWLKVDPLQLWRQLLQNPHGVRAQRLELQLDPARLERYFKAHEARAGRVTFEQDLLRQQDCIAMGFAEQPEPIAIEPALRTVLRAKLDRCYVKAAVVDEPWIERQLLLALGFARRDDDVQWWRTLLWRGGIGDSFSDERRLYALAALAWRAGSVAEGEAEESLCEALAHPRASARASAALYLTAAARLGQRGLSLRGASMLHQVAMRDPSLEPRVVARAMLELDKIECIWDHASGVFECAIFASRSLRQQLGECSLHAVQTGAHLHVMVCSARGWAMDQRAESFAISLPNLVRGQRFDLCRTDRLARQPAQLQLGSVGVRQGEQLIHHSNGVETVIVVRKITEPSGSYATLSGPAQHTELQLLESPVNGTRFHRAVEALAYLKVGDPLELRREASNAHDWRAVEVITQRGDKLGYIPRGQNQVISSLMDAGESLIGRVVEVDHESEYPVIFLRVHTRWSAAMVSANVTATGA